MSGILVSETPTIRLTTNAIVTESGVTDVKVNGTSVVTDNVANVTVPVKVSDILNDSGFVTASVNNLTNYPTNTTFNETVDELEQSITEVEETIPNVINNVTSTSTTDALSASMGKTLNDRINNLSNIGKFLAIWNCQTGLPTSNPTESPYTYHTGDYYRVGVVDTTTNYMPNGASYTTGVASTTVYTDSDLSIGAVFYYDGSLWKLQVNGGSGTVQDVQVDGTSVLSGGIANITGKENSSNKVTSISSSSTDTQYPSAKCVYDGLDAKVDKETGKGLSTNDFTGVYKDNVDSNTTARHTHSNMAMLTDITEETWTFTLSDDTTVTKVVKVGS